jgi:hypothetical protein
MEKITVLPTDIVIDIDNVLLKITVPKKKKTKKEPPLITNEVGILTLYI